MAEGLDHVKTRTMSTVVFGLREPRLVGVGDPFLAIVSVHLEVRRKIVE